MAVSKTDKKKAKRKAKLKQQRVKKSLSIQRSQRGYLLEEVEWLRQMGRYEDALATVQKVLRQTPGSEPALGELLMIGQALRRPELEFAALEGLHHCGGLVDYMRPIYCQHLLRQRRIEDACRVAEEGLALLPQTKISGKRSLKQFYTQLLNLPRDSPRLEWAGERPQQALPAPKGKPAPPVAAAAKTPVPSPEPAPPKLPTVIPPVPVTIEISESNFLNALEPRSTFSPDHYDLALEAHQIRLKETFDRLICLSRLKNIQSFPYQEETARKVLKRFRGRPFWPTRWAWGKPSKR
jgi:tetratricopeptide (TPR) repeat protein